MKEKLLRAVQPIKQFWKNQSKIKKIGFISGIIAFVLIISIAAYFLTKVTYVPLYSDLTQEETGLVKEQVEAKGISAKIGSDGTSILVPENEVSRLLVELAAEGYPETGTIDYSFFGQNSSFGLTDNEFNQVKLESTQNELAALIENIENVKSASVLLTLPESSVWVTEEAQQATASIVIETLPGSSFEDEQVQTLYKLVSKAVPNLPEENIVITDQFSNVIDPTISKKANNSVYEEQQQIKQSVERDIQTRVQQMLVTLMGTNKAVVNVTADIDFQKENRIENIVTPVDEKENEGIAVSIERIQESYTGEQAAAGGTVDGESDITAYSTNDTDDGDFEKSEERINYEFNRIQKEVEESPFEIRDLGIQVVVEPPNPDDLTSLSEQVKEDIETLLGTIVRTSIAKKSNENEISNEELNNKVFVSVQKFNSNTPVETKTNETLPWWIYIIAGLLLLIILILVLLLLIKRNKKKERDEEIEAEQYTVESIEDIPLETDNDATKHRKQIEKLAKENPDDFVKLLRTWLSED